MALPRLLTGRRRWAFARLAINGLAQAGAAVTAALLIRELFDGLSEGGRTESGLLILAVLAAGGLAVLLRFQERRDAARLGEDYLTELRLALFDAVSSQSAVRMERRGLGPMLLRFVTDLNAIRQWVTLGIAGLLVMSIVTVGSAVAVLWIEPVMGAAVGGCLALAGLVLAALRRPLESRVRDTRRRRARLASRIGDRLQAMATLQASARVSDERKALKRLSRRLARSAVRRATTAGIVRGAPEAALALSSAAVLAIGAARIEAGLMSLGDLLAVLLILGAVAPELRLLGRVQDYRINYRVARFKLEQILTGAQPATGGGKRRKPADGRLRFTKARVDGVFGPIDGEIDAGQRVAIKGAVGSGKSSLLAAITGVLDLDGGRISLGGRDLARLHPRERAAAIGLVSPLLPLIRGRLGDNVAYRAPEADDAAIRTALAAAGLEQWASEQQEGLDCAIAEGGRGLPDGVRQRIMLARAILGGPKLLLLDDADAWLDQADMARILRLAEGATVVLAVSEAAVCDWADRVFVLRDGALEEQGGSTAIGDRAPNVVAMTQARARPGAAPPYDETS